MRNAVRQYNFIKKALVLIRYFSWFKEVDSGSLNGLTGIKNEGLMVSKMRAVPQRISGERPLNGWSKRSSPLEKNWSLIGVAVLPSPASEQRLSIGNLNEERFVMFQLSPLLLRFSVVMERPVELRPKEMAIISLILTLGQRRWETSNRQTLLDPGTSGVQKGLSDSTPFILWMWRAIRPSQVSSLINRLIPCADIWLKHGDVSGFPKYPRWIMRWLLQGEDVIPIAFLRLFVSTCFWEYIWYSSLKENQGEMHLLKVSINFGRKGYLEDIIVLPLPLLKESVNAFCSITIMRNLTGVLPKKNIVQDSLEYSETDSGNPLDISRRVLPLKDISIPMDILIFLLLRERSPLSERLTLVVKLMLMVLLTSSEKNLRVNMLLPLSLLIERDWLLNKRIRLSSLSLFQLKVVLLLLCFNIQRGRPNSVCDVITLLSIKNQFAMLLVQSPK